jgi:hypothetical protein
MSLLYFSFGKRKGYYLKQKIIPVNISHLYFAFGRWRRIFSKALNNPST